MGRRGSGAWLAIAAEASALAEGVTEPERRRVVDGYAARAGRNPIALRRMVVAYDYVRRHADPARVRAASAAVEVLQRIERLDGAAAARLRPRALAGELPIHVLVDEERALVAERDDVSPEAMAMGLRDVRRLFADDGWVDLRSAAAPPNPSDTAAWVGADADDRGVAPCWALLVSPRLAISRLAGRPFDEFVRAIGLASCLYDQVLVFAASARERERVEAFFKAHRRDGRVPSNVLTNSPD